VLLVHPDTDPAALGLDLSAFTVKAIDTPALRDIVVIDCPDPDTSESADSQSNLARLRAIAPQCDLLLYVSTQQKYRSARVAEELGELTPGCRLVFVQTHADQDVDIRDDWRRCLAPQYQVPDMFFVDSRRAASEQAAGQRPTGDFGRLLDLLTNQLGASRRVTIRRANVLDLLRDALRQCREEYDSSKPAVVALKSALANQRADLTESLTKPLCDELLGSRSLWERRLVTAVTDRWGLSPFSAVLRLYNGLGALIASFSFFRARTSAQMALIGVVQGSRWVKSQVEALEADSSLERLAAFSLTDAQLQESRLVIAGYAHDASLVDRSEAGDHELLRLRRQSAVVEGQFLGHARRAVDELIEQLAEQHSSWLTRMTFEVLLLAYIAFLVGRIGHNFFWASFLAPLVNVTRRPEPLLSVDFYVPALIFLVLWSGLLVMLFVWRLRRGLSGRIRSLARTMVEGRLSEGLFPEIERTVEQIETDDRRLRDLADRTATLRRGLMLGEHGLGGRREELKSQMPN
jgi:hypothetical protein